MCLWEILHDFCGFAKKILLEMLWLCDRLFGVWQRTYLIFCFLMDCDMGGSKNLHWFLCCWDQEFTCVWMKEFVSFVLCVWNSISGMFCVKQVWRFQGWNRAWLQWFWFYPSHLGISRLRCRFTNFLVMAALEFAMKEKEERLAQERSMKQASRFRLVADKGISVASIQSVLSDYLRYKKNQWSLVFGGTSCHWASDFWLAHVS